MTRNVLALILLSFLIVLPWGQAVGQGEADLTYCGALSSAACALLRASDEAMMALTSVAYDAAFDLDVVIEDETEFSVSLSARGMSDPGQAQIDAVRDEILDMRVREVLALFEDQEALVSTVLGYAERVLTAPQFSADVRITAVAGTQTNGPINLRLRMVDGSLYGNSELLAAVGLSSDQWVSLDLVEVTRMLAEALQNPKLVSGIMSGMSNAPAMGGADETGSQDGDMSQGAGDLMAMISEFNARMAAIEANPAWDAMETDAYRAQVFTVQRLDDSEVDGVPVAVFETTLDFPAMADTEEFRSVLNDIFSLNAFVPEDEREAVMSATLDVMRTMTWRMTQAVGLEDHYLYSFAFTGEQTVDPGVFGVAMGEDPANAAVPSQTSIYTFTLTLTGHDQPVEVEAPDADHVVPLFQLLGLASAPDQTATPETDATTATDLASQLPEGWEATATSFPGMTAYEGPDGALLTIGAFPAPANAVLPIIAGNAGLESVPEPAGERDVNGVLWTQYESTSDNTVVLFAVASPEAGSTRLVLVAGPASGREALEAGVFVPALASQSSVE